jgi:Lon-like protease
MSPRLARQLLAGAFLVVLIVVAALLPVPYVALSPGPVFDTLGEVDGQPLITVTGAPTFPTEGQLDLTTVSENGGPGRSMSLVEALAGWVRPAVAVLPEELLYPPDATPDQIAEQNSSDMLESQDASTIAALRQAGVPLTPTALVAEVAPDGPSEGILEVGDAILRIDGAPVSSPQDVRDEVTKVSPGDEVRLRIDRDGTEKVVAITTAPATDDPTRPVIGIVPRLGYDSEVTVDIQLDNVGGPSAGLMFSLGIYDKLTPGPLTGGRHVAGTGTMAVDGAVGPIGGIQQKLRAARSDGATVFLVPADNCTEAAAAAPNGLRLVRVENLRSATRALEKLDKQGDTAVLPTC